MDEILWLRAAVLDLEMIGDYIAVDNRKAAERITRKILKSVDGLKEYPRMGRLLGDGDTHRLTVTDTSYLVFYRLRGRIEILAVFHCARKWPDHLR